MTIEIPKLQVTRPDLRDTRGRETPDRWAPQGRPVTENIAPAGGKVPAASYHDRYPLSLQSPEGRTQPLKP